jgi:hypothetical protein
MCCYGALALSGDGSSISFVREEKEMAVWFEKRK